MLTKTNDSLTADDIEEDRIGKEIVDAAIYVHSTLGPGLLESVYEACISEELSHRGFQVETQKGIPLIFRNKKLDIGFRLDALVNDRVVIEAKAVEKLLPVHEVQLMTYLKLTGKRLGYLINFNTPLVKEGIKRIVRRK